MSMSSKGIVSLAVLVASICLWLIVAGPQRIGIWETNVVGFFVLTATSWSALYVLFRLPRGESDAVISPGEWRAWAGALATAQLTLSMLITLYVTRGAALHESRYDGIVVLNAMPMVVGFVLVSWLIGRRWAGEVQNDERDREISRIAMIWGYAAMTLGIAGLVVKIGISSPENLAWARPIPIAQLLLLFMLAGGLFHSTTALTQYWRDRR